MDIKNDYFNKDRLEDMVGEIIIQHDNEDADRHLITWHYNYHNRVKHTQQSQIQLQTLNTTRQDIMKT